MVRVLVIDDAASFRALLGFVLPEEGDIEVVAQAAGLEEGLTAAAEHRPHVVLADVHLDGGRAVLDAVDALREAAGGARVLLLSGLPADDLAAASRRSGADGHVEKAADAASLRAAVRAAVA